METKIVKIALVSKERWAALHPQHPSIAEKVEILRSTPGFFVESSLEVPVCIGDDMAALALKGKFFGHKPLVESLVVFDFGQGWE